jgi:hypothetical protein
MAAFARRESMRTLLFVVGWCILFVLAWPLALLVLVVAPVVMLAAFLVVLPFRIAGIVVSALLAFLKSLLFLPARLLGHRG